MGNARLSVRVSYFWLSWTSGMPHHTTAMRNTQVMTWAMTLMTSAARRPRGPIAASTSGSTATLRCSSWRCEMPK